MDSNAIKTPVKNLKLSLEINVGPGFISTSPLNSIVLIALIIEN